VDRVYVVDPPPEYPRGVALPMNLRLVTSNEEGLCPIPDGTVDISATETRPSCASIAAASVPRTLLSPDRALVERAARRGLLPDPRALFNPHEEAMR
jgi:hypothetical protein